MPFVSFLPENAGIGHVMAADPVRYLPIGEITDNVLLGPSAFSVAERELIAAYVSGVNACQFCHNAHAAFAEAHGVDRALFDALLTDLDGAPVDPRLKPVLAYVRKLTLTPARMVQADADAVFAAGWDERALSDAIAICALFNLYNRLVDGHGVRKGTAEETAALTKWVIERGYAARTRMLVEQKGA